MTQLRLLQFFYDSIPIQTGDYKARGLIANAQRCVNLYTEVNPQDAEGPMTSLPWPGLSPFTQTPGSKVRCLYLTSWGELLSVVDNILYSINSNGNVTQKGTLAFGQNPVKISDNGVTALIVDGSTLGWSYTSTGVFAQITDPNFLGGTNVVSIDTFMVLNQPGTSSVYSTESNNIVFNPLFLAAKSSYPDGVATIETMNDNLWMIGSEKTSEVWADVGNTYFSFQKIPGVFINHGTIAPYSVVSIGLRIYWLVVDTTGIAFVLQGTPQYQMQAVTTFPISSEMLSYKTLTDAIGLSCSFGNHQFYILTFPTENKTWAFDVVTQQWNELVSIDSNGAENRYRANCIASAFGKILVGDYSNGMIYYLDLNNFTENGNPVVRRRGFMHLVQGGKRNRFLRLMADMQCGAALGTIATDPPQVTLRWSYDRGQSWGAPVSKSMGAGGQYNTQPFWSPIGTSRDLVCELFWSTPAITAVNGMYLMTAPAKS